MTIAPTFKPDIFANKYPLYGSRLVYGTSGLGGVWGKVDQEESINCILYALEHGISSFDTAPSYSNAEYYLGKALARWNGKKPFVSTKVGRLKADTAFDVKLDYSPGAMKESVMRSIDLLGVEKIDLLFLHEPQFVPVNNIEMVLETIISLKEEGMADMLGIGGNPTAQFLPFMKSKYFGFISSFCKMDACNLSAFSDLLPVTAKEGIGVYAASPLHFALLGNRFHFYTNYQPDIKEISRSDIDNALILNTLAEKYDLSLASLSQRFLFSVEEADRIVVGAKRMREIKNTIEDWNCGALPREIFDEIVAVNLTAGKKYV
jgi:aryl-alcohol dehydrogenase-like predicted oxidoreductase